MLEQMVGATGQQHNTEGHLVIPERAQGSHQGQGNAGFAARELGKVWSFLRFLFPLSICGMRGLLSPGVRPAFFPTCPVFSFFKDKVLLCS